MRQRLFCCLLAFETAQRILSKSLSPVEVQIFIGLRPMPIFILISPGHIRSDDAAARFQKLYGTAQVLRGLVRIRVIIERDEDGDVVVADAFQNFLPFRVRLVLVDPKAGKNAVIR